MALPQGNTHIGQKKFKEIKACERVQMIGELKNELLKILKMRTPRKSKEVKKS